MLGLLSRFDQFSFWAGFLAAALFIWLLGRILPVLREAWKRYRQRQATQKETLRVGVEYDYRNDFIRFIQGRHLASALFSLEEILIPPRLLAPPPFTEPGEEAFPTDSLSRILPYLPDYPEIASVFGAEKLTLLQALSGGANLAVMGPAGSGKSIALAHLGTQIASLSPDAGALAELVPFYLHAADLDLPLSEPADPVSALSAVILNGGYLSRRTAARFSNLVQLALMENRMLLLLDGVDELSPTGVQRVRKFIEDLLVGNPAVRIVATVSADYYDGITSLGLAPVCMAAWTTEERSRFIRRWGTGWLDYINPAIWNGKTGDIEIAMLYNWLEHDATALTPLELTLRVWAAFAGDSLGNRNTHSLDAYLRRYAAGIPNAETALERVAAQMALNIRPVAHDRAAILWSRGQVAELTEEDLAVEESLEAAEDEGQPDRVGRSTVSNLLNAGIFIRRPNEHISFAHPVLAGYYAGRGLIAAGGSAALAAQSGWPLRQVALHYLAAVSDVSPVLKALESTDPQHAELLRSGRWLRDMEPQSSGRMLLMRSLASLFQNDSLPPFIRLRAMAALALSADPTITTLSKKLLQSPDPLARGMCALVLGLTRDEKHTHDLSALLSDPSPQVRAAACHALANIGTQETVESVATLLLHGDEDSQRAAAEALALIPDDGYELLREASTMEDLLVRRAAIFGLGKTGHQEAIEVIRHLQLEDDQWIVRNVALQEMQRVENGSGSVPSPLKPLHETPWLITYASESGEGLAPGRASDDMLFTALLKGDVEQKLAAMDRYRLAGNDSVWTVLHEYLMDPIPELQTAALQTLWHLSAQGFSAQQD